MKPEVQLQAVRHRGIMLAAIATMLALAIVEVLAGTVLHIPAPTVLLAVVTYSAYAGGLGPGLTSALIVTLYGTYFYSVPNQLLRYNESEAMRLAWFALTAVVIAVLVGLLRRGAHASEHALQQSRDQLRAILEGVADGITVQDASGRLVYANDAAAKVIGYDSAAELLATPLSQVLGRFEVADETGQPLDLNRLPGRVALRGESSPAMVLRFRRVASGEERWSEVRATPVLDERGRVRLAVNLFHDVTDQRITEDRLRESETRFRATFESAGIGMAIVGMEGVTVESNVALQQMLGYTASELRGMVATEFTYPEDLAADLELYHQVLAGERDQYQLEKRYIRKDGRIVWGLLTVSVVRDSEGRPEFGIALIEDITERRRAQEAERKGEEASRLLASIVESSHDAIIGKTLDGIIVSWNPAAERLYGYSQDEAVGQPISMLAPPERPDEIPRILERIRRGERVDSFETVRLSKDGRRIEVSLTVSPITGPGGVPVGASAIARDISEQKHAEEMRVLAVSEERQRIAREMHDTVAQVLGYVNTQAEAAQRLLRAGETERAGEQLRQLGEAAREVYADVREDILGLRVSLGQEHDLASTLRDYLPRWQIQSGVTAELMISDTQDGPHSLAAGVDLQVLRIIQEALSNVRKHSHAHHVRVSLLDEPGGRRVIIEDDGDGFEPDSDREDRLGHVGMSVMRERAASIGTDLAVESAPGRGTRVRLYLPLGDRQGVTTGGSHARPHS